MARRSAAAVWLIVAVLVVAGCKSGNSGEGTADKKQEKSEKTEAQKIEAARAKLSAEDRELVDKQDFCPIMSDKKLGSMGTPHRLVLKDQVVFVCCKACKKAAEKDPDDTLKKVAELTAKK